MIRKLLWGALLLGTTAYAQTPPNRTAVPSPLPASATTATPVVPQAAPSSGASSNPFAPKSVAVAPLQPPPTEIVPPPPPPKTEESVRADVESAFRARGARVGRVNGQTFFKLENSYLFVPTGLEDAQPVVPAEGHTLAPKNASTVPGAAGSAPRAVAPPPPIPSRPSNAQ
jgi:hypothetical protein